MTRPSRGDDRWHASSGSTGRSLPLLAAFAGAAIVVCSDHGDCWGEDGLWEHGIHHARTLEVPLLFRLP